MSKVASNKWARVQKAKGSTSIIRIGPNIRRDKTARLSVYLLDEDTGSFEPVHEGPVPRKGRLKLPDLEMSESYLVFVNGERCGVAMTTGLNLKPPFHVSIDTEPEQQPRPSLLKRLLGRQ